MLYKPVKLTSFQFHKGTIKPANVPLQRTWFQFTFITFFTIKPANVPLQPVSVSLFQFHKGTIKPRWRKTVKQPPARHFNSIKVRLNPILNYRGPTAQRYFNSIKVRLNLTRHNLQGFSRSFQFHKGTIKPK